MALFVLAIVRGTFRGQVGAGEISTGKAPRERRGGHACKIAKLKTGGIEHCKESKCPEMLCKVDVRFKYILLKYCQS